MNLLRYEAKFYEWQALCHVAELLSLPVYTNIREFRPDKTVWQQREIDGIVRSNGRLTLVEAKSSKQDQQDIQTILTKYRTFEHDELLIVAPDFAKNVRLPVRARLVQFVPDLSPLVTAYWGRDFILPPDLAEELQYGDHHFRYLSVCRRSASASFRNQVDKRITAVSKVFGDIRRWSAQSDLPIRVFWSVSRWLFPKDLFYSKTSNYLTRRGLVFDIDGKAAHTPNPCQIMPGLTICTRCFESAKEKTMQLLDLLESEGFSHLSVVFSGRQGFHVYVLKQHLDQVRVRELVQRAIDSAIPVDANLAADPKSVVTFPGSIHGLSMLRAKPVQNLGAVTLEGIVRSSVQN